MRTLYHYPLDPASRQARIALAEKKLKVKLELIDPWAPDPAFLELAAEGVPPTLMDVVPGRKIYITGARAICEYANDGSPRHPLLPEDRLERAEARRIASWFDLKFAAEVNAYILHEKIEKSLTGGEAADPAILREGREHLYFHLSYISWLLEQRDHLACNTFSLADIAGAANISCLDFLGEITWRDWPRIQEWYQRIKSRPTVQPLLDDHIAGLRPPRHYRDLDF